jgi:hypothetical protein
MFGLMKWGFYAFLGIIALAVIMNAVNTPAPNGAATATVAPASGAAAP